jgi:dipeptide/tripeptide permease
MKLVTIPVIDIVGVAVMASEKPAVMVTTSEVVTILLLSVSVKVTVGAVVSKVKVILSVPE